MCLQATAMNEPSTLQTLDRVKSYKVVGKVSEYARDFAETSTIYNYIAPITNKGIDKVTPYVANVSQYVPNKYVQKVDSLGVTCLQRFEDVTSTSEEALNGVKTYVKTMLPAKDEEELEKPSYIGSIKTRVLESSKKRVDWVATTLAPATTRVNGVVNAVSTKVSTTISPVTDKVNDVVACASEKVNGVVASTSSRISEKISPVKTKVSVAVENAKSKVSATVAPVTKKVNETYVTVKAVPSAIVSGTKRRANDTKENINNFYNNITYDNVTAYAVASTSYTLKSTKNLTISYVPSSYRDQVEGAITSCEERIIHIYKRIPTAEERGRAYSAIKNVDRHQLKELSGVVIQYIPESVVSYTKWASSPVMYVVGKVVTRSVQDVPEVYDAPEAAEPAALLVDDAPEVN